MPDRRSTGARPAALTGSVLPTLAGNILGGTVLFALLAWAQIRAELHRQRTGEG